MEPQEPKIEIQEEGTRQVELSDLEKEDIINAPNMYLDQNNFRKKDVKEINILIDKLR